MSNTISFEKRDVKVIAHRGVSGLERENTNAAFVAAGNRSYYGIETDMHVTADGEFILIHDDNTERVAIDNLKISACTLNTLRGLQLCDLNGEKTRGDLRLPTLSEYISICKKYDKQAILELKASLETSDLLRCVKLIEDMEYADRVTAISFNAENLKKLRLMRPEWDIQFLTKDVDEQTVELLEKYHFDLDVYWPSLNEQLVSNLHESGIKINCWTVNRREEAERLVEMGVDFITTNILE